MVDEVDEGAWWRYVEGKIKMWRRCEGRRGMRSVKRNKNSPDGNEDVHAWGRGAACAPWRILHLGF